MTAVQLSRLLAARHADGVFIPECKMGAAGSRSLDGWALLPTWSPMTAIGYETKVSRSDWLQDQKYEEYRAACHLFFVVAPKGIVERGELPAGVGLLEPIGTGTGQRLVMRVKAVRQEADPAKLSRLMAYALMWRRVGGDPGVPVRARQAAMWRHWVEELQEFHKIGRSVSKRMRTLVTEAQAAQRVAELRAEQLEGAEWALRELGVTAGWDRWVTKRKIEEALSEGRAETLRSIRAAQSALDAVARRVEQVAAIETGNPHPTRVAAK